jgi:hypothetical protein
MSIFIMGGKNVINRGDKLIEPSSMWGMAWGMKKGPTDFCP